MSDFYVDAYKLGEALKACFDGLMKAGKLLKKLPIKFDKRQLRKINSFLQKNNIHKTQKKIIGIIKKNDSSFPAEKRT